MTKATEAFTVRGPDGLVSFKPGEDVPDEIAALVGEHVLDHKPEPNDNPFEGMDFENADEALKAALEVAAQQAEQLETENEKLTAQVEDLQAWKDKVLSGDLSDLDLETLNVGTLNITDAEAKTVGGEGAGDEPQGDLFDPGEHDVKAVLKHLETADEAEDARVRAAEMAGKNRKSIVGDDE